MIYLDHAATTPVDARVVEAMLPYFADDFGNASSLYELGRRARSALDQARSFFAEQLNCLPRGVVFTSGGTESCNLALFGTLAAGERLLVSRIEHSAVLKAAEALEHKGVEVVYLEVDGDGLLDLKQLEEELAAKETKLVSVGYANNEIGVIQDLLKISKLCKQYGALLHTDVCQAAGYLSLDMQALGVDLMTMNASKIYGPKGIGLLAMTEGVELSPQIFGGGQEFGLRSGTENTALIVGFAKAYEIVLAEFVESNEKLADLRNLMLEGLLSQIEGAKLTGSKDQRLPNHLSLIIPEIEGESLLIRLDQEDIYVSTGSACSSGSLEPSHVLKAIGVTKQDTFSSLRITLGRLNDRAQIEQAIEKIVKAVTDLREIGSGLF